MFHNNITLSNGVKVPQLALGTWLIDNDKAADAVKAAINIGYRYIDTAQAYMNEAGVGEGIRNCGVSRDEMISPQICGVHTGLPGRQTWQAITLACA